jgi:phosphoribosylamine--glycine ligase
MRVLLVGGGGREHALAWKLAQSPACHQLWCAPGNAGIAALADCLPIAADDVDGLAAWSMTERPDLVVIGPEVPLVGGLADRLRAAGIPAFGPSAAAARIEGSKAYAKDLMARAGIATAGYRRFDRWEEARAYLDACEMAGTGSLVVKASGLAAGKGAIVCETIAAARSAARSLLVEGMLGAAGREVVIEERMEGEEASLLAITDGATRRYCLPAQDHKRVGDGDRGPMTGGMGACAPAPVVTPGARDAADARIFQPALGALAAAGAPFHGCLYAGLMFTAEGPKVVEFNARFGDPETQAIMPLLESDVLPLLYGAATGALASQPLAWSDRRAVCVVICAPGYPQATVTGAAIEGLEQAAAVPDAIVFHAGTSRQGGNIVTAGGRVLNVVGLGSTIRQAAAHAYAAVEQIGFEGAFCRRDIGWRAIEREERDDRGGSA